MQVKYSSLQAMRQVFPSTVESGIDIYKMLAARDSLLLEPPTYQIEAGFGTWIESDGNTKPMRGDDPEEDDNMVYQNVPGPCCNDSCENPHGLIVRASFVAPSKDFHLFQTRYQRNNKKGGQKNLRCFPCCRNRRHVSSGFCGDSIRVHVAVSRITESGGVKICPIQTSRPAVLAFARFVNLEGAFDTAVSGPEVFPGQTIEKHEIFSSVRDKEHPMNPLFPGILRGAAMESASQSAIFEFNAECKAWHYGWTAPRGQGLSGSDAQHVLEVLFMKPMGSYMYCLERLRSDGFSIYSSRRASHATIKPEGEPFQSKDDDRIYKRKRTEVLPSSPATSSVSSSTATPRNDDGGWRPMSAPSPMNGGNGFSHAPSSVNEMARSFKVETPFTSGPLVCDENFQNCYIMPNDKQDNVGSQSRQQDPSLLYAQLASNDSNIIDLTMPMQPNQQQTMQQQQTMHQQQTNDLMSHSLFVDLPARRFVSSEELPWSELYNLFDAGSSLALNSGSGDEQDPDNDGPDSPSTSEASSYSAQRDEFTGTSEL